MEIATIRRPHDLSRHPLALRAEEKHKLISAGLLSHGTNLIRPGRPTLHPGLLRKVAEEYLSVKERPIGTVRQMAEANDLKYESLMTTIGQIRTERSRMPVT